MKEVWATIPSFPAYEASSFGGIRSQHRVLRQYEDDDGFKYVNLSVDGIRVIRRVHFLVCEGFHGVKPDWAAGALHIRGTKNQPRNLRWSTLLRPSRKAGEDHPWSTFTKSQIVTVRRQYAAAPTPATVKRLAEAFIVTPQTIRDIIRERTWKGTKPSRRRAA